MALLSGSAFENQRADFLPKLRLRDARLPWMRVISPVYCRLLDFAEAIRRDNRDLRPRDMIDLQSFIWAQGSDEYPG